MGCCLSREDDHFDSSNEALLPKGRNGNTRAEKSLDVDLAHKDNANGCYKSPSAVVAAADKVPAKPQPPNKPEESVDLMVLDDKPPTPVAPPVIKAPSPANPVPLPSPPQQQAGITKLSTSSEPAAGPTLSPPQPADEEPSPPPKPIQSSLPNGKKASSKTSPIKPTEAEDNVVVPAFTPVSVEAMDANDDDDNDDDQENERDENEGDNDDATSQQKEPKPKKITPTKKSKKKRKKGKK